MKDLYSYSFSSLKEEMFSIGEKEYRAKQLYSWIYKKRVKDFSLFSDISKNFISYLQDNYYLSSLKTEVVQKSSDGTIKCLFSLEDNQKVEAVLMHYVYGYSVCISSQVGCNMSCAFCASGLLKKRRNLTSGEMIRQVLFFDEMLKKENKRVSHVVIM